MTDWSTDWSARRTRMRRHVLRAHGDWEKTNAPANAVSTNGGDSPQSVTIYPPRPAYPWNMADASTLRTPGQLTNLFEKNFEKNSR